MLRIEMRSRRNVRREEGERKGRRRSMLRK